MYSSQPDAQTLVPPPLQAFQRLWVTDGLRMTAKRWHSAHHYHRQRQNFHYQATQQTGIVCGLGVATTQAPDHVNADYRDGRWLQIQPGLAIDAHGNPIVVTRPQLFRIQSTPPVGETWRVYLVAQYVDPDGLEHPEGREQVEELFRIVEKTHLDALDVELCRFQIESGPVTLQTADNVYEPGLNTLDFRHRAFIQARPWGLVRMAQVTSGSHQDDAIAQQLSQLLEATETLFPKLRGEAEVDAIPIEAIATTPLSDHDLLYLPYSGLRDLTQAHMSPLKQFLNGGGTLLVVASSEASRLGELKQVKQQLLEALSQLDPALDTRAVEAEIAAYDTEITQVVQEFGRAIAALAHKMNYPISGGRLDPHHPIRRYPFLFSALPSIDGHPITLFNWGGIVMVVGNLPSLWGIDDAMTQSRESIRTAQELGINLLHFAWRRRHMMELQTPHSPS